MFVVADTAPMMEPGATEDGAGTVETEPKLTDLNGAPLKLIPPQPVPLEHVPSAG